MGAAFRRIDIGGVVGAGATDPSGSAAELREILIGVFEDGDELPDRILRDSELRAAAQRLEQQMFAAMTEELTANRRGVSAADILNLMRIFARVRARLAEASSAAGVEDEVALRWETIELAHDLRSPLTSILFLTETLRRGQSGPVSELQHRQLGIIYTAALGLVSLANDVIGLVHGGEQLMDRAPSAFSLRELLECTVEVVQPIAEDRKLTLRLLVQAPDQRIGHPAILSRIFLNLTTNALKNTDEGMVELVARATTGDGVELSVRDTGRGMDETTIANLYKPLRPRTEGTRPSLDSYGLGLTICRKLVQAIGSELRYETSPGWGTRFYFDAHLPPAFPIA